MANPFLRRATEYIREDSSFLAIVSPAPLTTYFAKHPRKDAIFEVPVRVIGTPGSGKTMMASLAEFRLVEAILRDQSSGTNRDLAGALSACGFIDGERPRVAAVRIPMESEYRDFWELPYPEVIRTKLALSLVQARAMLGLIRNLTANRSRAVRDIRFIAKDASEAHLEQIGGLDSEGIRRRALEVQKAIYGVAAGLVPPDLNDLPEAAREPYQPLEAIQEIEIDWQGEAVSLRPLVILDDVHALHPDQYEGIFAALARREIKVGRWLMMRMDALSPGVVFRSPAHVEAHNLKPGRDFLDVLMQNQAERRTERAQFRKMAIDMADRYLPLVTSLRDRNFTRIVDLLPATPPQIPPGKVRDLAAAVDRDQRRLGITPSRRAKIDKLVEGFMSGTKSADKGEEVTLGMSRVLLYRYANRVANMSPDLFKEFDPEPKVGLKADTDVADAARLRLYHDLDRPLHYGFDDLCDASNENAELFLQLAGALVSRMETRAIRNQDPALPPSLQQSTLRERSVEIINGWAFPYARKVRDLITAIADECVEVSLSANARLGSGANAVGIPVAEFEALVKDEGELTRVLKFAAAYGALNVVPDYGQGGKIWCLLELSGPVCLARGLTFKRGGFLEWRVDQLDALVA